MWIGRLRDHDGVQGDEGGIEAWLRLARAVGLTPEETQDERHVLPGVRFAVDAYVAFARNRPWPIAVASSLTELFAPDLMSQRLAAFERFYSWVPSEGLDYFRKRLTQAPADSSGALELTTRYCTTRELQEEAIRGLSFKCDILWSMLDTIVLAYGAGHPGERGAQSSSPSPGAPQLREPEIDPSPSQPSPWSEGARPQLTKKARFKPDPVTGQATLLYPEGVLVLNPTGEAIVRLCDGKNTVDQIVAELASRYKTAPNMIAPDVAEYLDRLTERRLIEGPGTSLEDIS